MRLRAQRRSPHSRRNPLTLEKLEDRTLLSGNLIVSAEVPGTANYNLMQYTQQGALVSSQPIPPTPGATETPDARGLSVDPSGNVNVFDGTQSPSVATLSSSTQNWLFQTTPGWGTNSNITYGDVVAYKNYIFASNMQQLNGQSNGIVRFDSSGGPPVLFAPGSSFIQIALGQDGLLYGLESSGRPTISQTVQVFDPDTLAPVRTFTLNSSAPNDIRSIAVDRYGNILAASWGGNVTEYDKNGNPNGASILLKSPFGFSENLLSIALDTDGQVAIGGHQGDIYLTNESLTNVQIIQTNQWNAFVTFDHYIGTAPQMVTPTFSSLVGPSITYGQASVTLGGTLSADSSYPPGSVNITLAGQTESAAINPSDGSFSAVFNTSTLGAATSPYTITYSYPGQNNFAAVTDTSQSLTVNQAVTTLSNLAAPTIVYGTSTVTLSGSLESNSVLPVGQDVTVSLIGVNGPVASGSGTINSNGLFSVTIDTAALEAGSYTIEYAYAGDANFTAVTDTSNALTINQATTSLSGLSSATIDYGTSAVTLSGTLGSDSVLPVGQDVAVTLIGTNGSVASGSGAIDGNGQFSVSINTAALNAGSYTIQYVYVGDANFTASTDTSTTLTINQATTALSSLSSSRVVVGTRKVTFSGTVSSDSVLPVGQSVTVTLVGAKGSVARGSGVIDNSGNFTVTINTHKLAVGSYTIEYSYAGDANFQGSNGSGTLLVTYAIKKHSGTFRPVRSGAELPIRLEVTDAWGKNLSSAHLTVTAISLIGPNGQRYSPHAEGRTDANNAFCHVHGGYVYDLDTHGLPAGTYTLLVKVSNDPVLHVITFGVHDRREREHHRHKEC